MKVPEYRVRISTSIPVLCVGEAVKFICQTFGREETSGEEGVRPRIRLLSYPDAKLVQTVHATELFRGKGLQPDRRVSAGMLEGLSPGQYSLRADFDERMDDW